MNCHHCRKPVIAADCFRDDSKAVFCSSDCLGESDAQRFLLTLPRAYRRTDPALLPCQPAAHFVFNWTPEGGTEGTNLKTSLYLHGPTGAGKTRSALHLACLLIKAGEVTRDEVHVFRSAQFAEEVIGRTKPDGRGGFDTWFQSLTDCDVLIFDEADKLAWTTKVASVFFDLVESRTSNERACIFIAQQRASDWLTGAMNQPRKNGPTRETFEAIQRRLVEFFAPVHFTPDAK